MMNNNSKIYIISDLHLSNTVDKPMDIFGAQWSDYMSRIKHEWEMRVSCDDYVIIPGDISWGMTLEEACEDLKFLNRLPGRKILMKGNHDYWWTSLLKLNMLKNEKCLESLNFMHTNSFYINECDTVIVGTRGWKCPGDKDFTADDMKIYKRELLRFEMSLKDAEKYGAADKICIFHYPPFNAKSEPSGFTEIMKNHGIKECFFGHLHGLCGGVFENAYNMPVFATVDGIEARLVSSDYIDFIPLNIC